eukprot:47312_1
MELNRLFDGVEFTLADRYAAILNTVYVTLLYSSGMPFLFFSAAATFFFTYWFDKYSFFRLYRKPPRYDATLSKWVIEVMKNAVYLHVLFAMWAYSSPSVMQSYSIDAAYLQNYASGQRTTLNDTTTAANITTNATIASGMQSNTTSSSMLPVNALAARLFQWSSFPFFLFFLV